jgi:hypothetical protein
VRLFAIALIGYDIYGRRAIHQRQGYSVADLCRINRRDVLGGLAATLAAGTVGGCAGGGVPRAPAVTEAWDRWVAHEPTSTRVLDHRPLDAILARHLRYRSDGIALFPYGEVPLTEQEALDDYIRWLTDTQVGRLNRREQYAYWINLHNVLLLRLVMRRYLVMSVRDIAIGTGPFADNAWQAKLVAVRGVPVSLSDIVDRILRPIWRDPRVHYGLSLAAVGGPNLLAHAFTGANIDRLLDDAAVEFVNHPRGVRVEARGLVLSGLYDRYRGDFGTSVDTMVKHVRLYAAPPISNQVAGLARARFEFDWSLNDGTGLAG